MGTYDEFRTRMGRSGTSQGDAYSHQTISIINNKFANAPTFAQIPIDGVTTDVRVHRDLDVDDAHTRRLTFRPSTAVNEGAYVQYDGKTWLMDKFDPHPYFPTGHILECGETLRWKLQDGTVKQYACVMYPDSREAMWHEDKEFITSTYQTKLYVQYNADTTDIREGLRVILGNRVFELIGTDAASHVFNGHGYIIFNPQLVTSNPQDDWTNRIADNSAYYITDSKQSGGGFTW